MTQEIEIEIVRVYQSCLDQYHAFLLRQLGLQIYGTVNISKENVAQILNEALLNYFKEIK